jgi:glycosyltransferase involved in cell wall biosynthesis
MLPIQLGGRPVDPIDPLRLSRCLSALAPGHFFNPGFNAPIGKPCPFSLTVHDLIPLDVLEERSLAKSAYFQWIVKPALSNAAVVFTGSEHARQRLAEWSGLPMERFVVTGYGVSSEFHPDGSRWANARPYLLYVGNQKPHKNVEGLVEAFASSGLACDFDLLLTGEMSASVSCAVSDCRLADAVRSLGLVREEDLPSLYRGAHALVMPSRYEGFGLPVLEAMACGTPVLSSDKTALPEVGGDAIAYFDPDDRESFVEGLRGLLNTRTLSGMRLRGLERSKLFDWDRVADQVNKTIAEVDSNR